MKYAAGWFGWCALVLTTACNGGSGDGSGATTGDPSGDPTASPTGDPTTTPTGVPTSTDDAGTTASDPTDGDTSATIIDAAFRVFTSYDDAGAHFGDTSIHALTSDGARTSVYASYDAQDPARTVVVAINKTDAPLTNAFLYEMPAYSVSVLVPTP